jgi:hypothetical protein
MPVKNPKLLTALLVFFLITALLVTPVVLWAVTIPKGNIKTSCSSDADCGGTDHGTCVNGACKCNSPWGGPYCDVLGNLNSASLTAGQGVACSQIPTPCKTSQDCAAICSQDVQYSCETIAASQNSKGLSGQYCLPTQPASNCLTGVTNQDSIPGFYTWQGWADVETMAWTCDCEYPNFYPLTTESSGGNQTQACIKSDQVCQHGTWNYPCIRDPKEPLSCLKSLPTDTCNTVCDCPGCGDACAQQPCKNPSECSSGSCVGGFCTLDPSAVTTKCGTACINKTCQKTCKLDSDCGGYPCVNRFCATNVSMLVGANPFEYGQCDCSNHSCTTSKDCAGDCLKGTCVNQRVALGPNGVPTCVRDTCAPGGTFVAVDTPPYTYGYCECSTGYEAQGNTCVYQGSEAPSTFCALGCGHGKCIGSGQCKCDDGWKGNANCTKFSCDMKGGCGYGTCIGPNTCACDPGYTTDSNGSCTQLACPQGCVNGTCVKGPNGPTCQCNPGYTGPSCSDPITVTCSMTVTHESNPSETQGACVSTTGQCSYGQPSACSNNSAFFGNNNSFDGGTSCNFSCTQGYKTPAVAGLPPLLCSNGTSTAPCSATTCSNAPVPLNTCLQNDIYAYSCTDLCTTYNTMLPFDYNTLCKGQPAPPKPTFCT